MDLPETLDWFEFGTPDALYLLWRQRAGNWGGIEFVGDDRSNRRNKSFLARFEEIPQWVAVSLQAAKTIMEQVIVSRRRLEAQLNPPPSVPWTQKQAFKQQPIPQFIQPGDWAQLQEMLEMQRRTMDRQIMARDQRYRGLQKDPYDKPYNTW